MHIFIEQALKHSFLEQPLHRTLFEILSDIKAKSAIHVNYNFINDNDKEPMTMDSQMMRLDNMLAAEGITPVTRLTGHNTDAANAVAVDAMQSAIAAPTYANACGGDSSCSVAGDLNVNSGEHAEYQLKLAEIRRAYVEQYSKYTVKCEEFTMHVKNLLLEQSKARPIGENECMRMVRMIQRKFLTIPMQLKQSVCESVMMERSK